MSPIVLEPSKSTPGAEESGETATRRAFLQTA